jgi:hypothetical protein
LSYLAAHARADERLEQGHTQTYCYTCGRYKWSEELCELAVTDVSGFHDLFQDKIADKIVDKMEEMIMKGEAPEKSLAIKPARKVLIESMQMWVDRNLAVPDGPYLRVVAVETSVMPEYLIAIEDEDADKESPKHRTDEIIQELEEKDKKDFMGHKPHGMDS